MSATQTAYVNENQEASVVCANCGRQKMFNAAPFQDGHLRVKARCGCGFSFIVTFERRRAYRKKVNLSGQYLIKNGGHELGEMVVEDISRTGIGFRAYFRHGIKVGDVVQVSFQLDNADSTRITKNAVVRNVRDRFIGAEFCDNELEKTLGFYLMP